jgi:hypothetical protein
MPTSERLGKQLGYNRPDRSAFPLVDGLGFPQNGIIDVEVHPHDA